MAISSKDFIKRYRDANRTKYLGAFDLMTDEQVYNRAKRQYPNVNVEEFTQSEDINKVDTSPGFINKLGDFASDVSDYFVNEESLKIHQYAVNNSMTGAAYKIATGEDKYPEVAEAVRQGEYEPGMLKELYAGMLSFTFPVDLAVMIGTGGFSGVAGKGLARTLGAEVAKKGGTKKFGQLAIENGLTLGGFMGAASTLAESAEQSEAIKNGQQKSFDKYKIARSGMEGFLEGGVLGASVGAVASVFSKNRSAMKKKLQNVKELTLPQKIGKLAVSTPTEIVVEGGVFTALPYAYRGAPTKEDGTLDMKAIGTEFFLNTNIIGGLQLAFAAGNKLKRKDLEDLKEKKDNNEKVANELNVTENSVRDNIRKEIADAQELLDGYDQYKPVMDKVLELGDNPTREQLDQLLKDNPDMGGDAIKAHNFLIEAFKKLSEEDIGVSGTELNRMAKDLGISAEGIIDERKKQYETTVKTLQDLVKDRNKPENYAQKIDDAVDPEFEDLTVKTLIDGLDKEQFKERNYNRKELQEIWNNYNFKTPMVKKTETFKSRREAIVNQLFEEQANINRKERVKGTGDAVTYNEIKNFNESINVLGKSKDRIPDIVNSDLSEANKNLLAYNNFKRKAAITKGQTDSAISFMNWAENKYKTSIDLISSADKQGLVAEYFNDSVTYKGKKINIVDLKTKKAREALEKLGMTELEINALRSYKKTMYRNLLPTFGDKGILKNVVGDLFGGLDQGNSKSRLTPNLTGGYDQGLKNWSSYAKSIDFHDITKTKRMSGEGLSIAVELGKLFKIRTGELPLFKIQNVNKVTGQIELIGRQKGGIDTRVTNKALAKRIHKYVKEAGVDTDGKIFDVTGNEIAKYLTKKTDNKIVADDAFLVGSDGKSMVYKLGEKVKQYKVEDGKIVSFEGIPKGFNPGSIFRRIIDEDIDLDLEARKAGAGKQSRSAYIITEARKDTRQRATNTDTVVTRPESEIQFGDKQVPRQEFFGYVKKKYKLNDEQLKEVENLGRGKSWGEYEDGKIRLAQGKFEPIDFFHELTHFHEAYVRKVGDQTGIRLYDQLDNIVIRTKEYRDWQRRNPGKDSVEFYTDKVALQKLAKAPRGAGARFRRWLQNLKSNVLTTFLGGKFASKKDILIRLSKELDKIGDRDMNLDMKGSTVLIGGKRAATSIVRSRTPDRKSLSKKAVSDMYHRLENMLIREGKYTKDMLRKMREDFTGHSDWKLENTPRKAVNEWYEHLQRIQMKDMPLEREPHPFLKGEKLEQYNKNRDMYDRDKRNRITYEDEKRVLTSMGVKDGDIRFADADQVMELSSWADRFGQKVPEKTMDIVYDIEVANSMKNDRKWGWIMEKVGPMVAPVHHVMTMFGAKRLGKKLKDHIGTELRHTGVAVDIEYDIRNLVGKKNMNRLSYLVDKDRYKARKDANLLDNKDIELYNEIYDRNGRVRRDTAAGQAYIKFDELRNYYWDEIKEVARDKQRSGEITKAQLSRFEQDFQKKFVMDYFPRRLTDKFKRNFDSDAKWYKETLNKVLLAEGREQVLKRKFNDSRTYKEEIARLERIGDREGVKRIERTIKNEIDVMVKDPKSELVTKAESELFNMFEFSPETVRNPYLFKRGLRLPEVIEVDGKKIQVYETNYAESMGNYSRTMSRFISTAEHFPEFTKMFRDYGMPTVKSDILKAQMDNFPRGRWMLNQVKQQLGILEADMMSQPLSSGLQRLAQETSKFALSFPTAGLKNVIVGSPQTVAVFGPINTIRGMAKNFDADARATLRRSGAVEAGLKYLDEMKTSRVGDFAFKLGLMKPTENFNRLTAIFAGREYLKQSLRMADNKKVRNGMKKMFNLDDGEIDLLRQHGLDLTKIKANPIAKPAITRALDKAIHKVDTWSHLNTQGGTSAGLVPYWFNAPLVKPFLLFQKMAYAATNNLKNNVVAPMNLKKFGKGGNFMPLIQFTAASTLGGYTLMKVYDQFLGVTPPNANDPWWNKIINYMWKAEMLGIFSETLSPFQSSNQLTESLYPAIYKNGTLLANELTNFATGKKTIGQSFDDALSGTVSAYNQIIRVYERKLAKGSRYNREVIALNKIKTEFAEALGKPPASFDNNPKSPRTKFYRDFKTVFNQGDMEEAAKKWLAALFAVRDSYVATNGYTYKGASEAALAEMKKQIERLEPLNLSDENTKRVISKKRDFINYLNPNVKHGVLGKTGNKKYYDMLIRTQKEYGYKRRQLLREIQNYVRKYGLKEFYPLLKSKQRLAVQ